MATLTKTERALRGPGFLEIILGVFLSIALGLTLGVVYLVFKPAEVVKEPPKEPVIGTVYFVEGSTDANKSRQWMRKRQMLSEGGTADLMFSEDELNAWIASVVPQAGVKPKAEPGAKPDAAAAKSEPGGPLVVLNRPNFRIRDSVLQMGLPATFNAFGVTLPLVVQARGHFERVAGEYVFVADELYVGSLPTHRLPGLKDLIVRRMLLSVNIPDDLRTAWGKLSLIAVEGNGLHLSLP